MKHFSISPNILLVILLVFILFRLGLPEPHIQIAEAASSQTQNSLPACDSSRMVNVSGTAMVNVPPDHALIQLGVQSNGTTPGEVRKINDNAILQVIKTLHTLNIEAKDIATDYYTIEPIYESYDSLFIKGYRINNIVAVTLRNVNQISEVIGATLESGANQVINVEFYTNQLRQYRDQARELAMKAASEKAQALAKAGGSETGCVLSISENTWSYYNGWWYGRDRNLWTQNTIQNTSPISNTNGDVEPVSLGQISVRAEVTVSFSLK